MRISNLQIFHRGLQGITDNQVQVNRTQQQLSSGRKVLSPADAPVDSTRILQLNQDNALRTQYEKNITSAENRLRLEESVLNSLNDNLQRVRELTVQAGNGSMTQSDRTSIAAEVTQRLDGIVSLMNTRDAGNEYIFSGFLGKQQPFVSSPGGGFVYMGDEGQRHLPIAEGTLVATGDSGKALFVNVDSAQTSLITQASPGNIAVPAGLISQGDVFDQAALDDLFPDDLIIGFNSETDIVPPAPNFTVRRRSDGRVMEGMSNVTLVSAQSVQVAGVEFAISGSPAAGDSFIVQTTDKQSLTRTLENLTTGLTDLQDNPEDSARLEQLLNDSLVNLDNARDNILTVRSQLGGRLNTVENIKDLHQSVEFNNKLILSSLQDVDFAEATSRLAMESFVLEAAQQSYVKISNLSLISLLR